MFWLVDTVFFQFILSLSTGHKIRDDFFNPITPRGDAIADLQRFDVELYGWKAKMYDMIRKVDQLRSSDKDKILSRVEELHKNISEMERLIEKLQAECPIEFGAEKNQIEGTTADMKKRYEEPSKKRWHIFKPSLQKESL